MNGARSNATPALRKLFQPVFTLERRRLLSLSPTCRSLPPTKCLHTLLGQTYAQSLPRQTLRTNLYRRPIPKSQSMRNPQRTSRRKYTTQKPDEATEAIDEAKLSFIQKLRQRYRHFTRKHGWPYFGVYIMYCLADLPFCYMALRWVGTERIEEEKQAAISYVVNHIPQEVKDTWYPIKEQIDELRKEGKRRYRQVRNKFRWRKWTEADEEAAQKAIEEKKAEKAKARKTAGFFTQMALVLAIHKTLLVIRVPLTLATAPSIIRAFSSRGYDLGKFARVMNLYPPK